MKLENIYNLASFQAFKDSANINGATKREFSDSVGGLILAQSLIAIDPTILTKQLPDLTFVNSGIIVDNTGGYVEQIKSKRKLNTGGFKRAGDLSANKGKIGLAGEDNYIKVFEYEGFSNWTDSEIQRASLAGENLPSDFISAHSELYQRFIDQAGYLGIEGNAGLLNYGFTSSSAGGLIGTLTAQQMYDAFATLITNQWNSVKNTTAYMANRVDMPVSVFNKIAVTMMDTSAGTQSVLKALQGNFAGVSFQGTDRAEGGNFSGGASRTVAYSNTSDSMIMRIPEPLTIGEIIKLGSFNFHVDSKFRIAGLDVLETTSGKILTGL